MNYRSKYIEKSKTGTCPHSLFVGLITIYFSLLPQNLNAQTYDITKFGALGDSVTDNTKAIQEAIDACSLTGGKVYVPQGVYLSGTLILKSHVILHISQKGKLLGSTDLQKYPPQKSRISFYGEEWAKQALIFCQGQENVTIEGEGTIDGQGASFVINTNKKPDRYRNRPYLLWFIDCKDIKVTGVHLRNSAFWMQHYLCCQDVLIDGINVWNHANKNNDLMDIDGCKNVMISNVIGDSDDDGLTIKSTSPHFSEYITISNCILSSHCNALKLGTESTGGFRNIVVSNCVIKPSSQKTCIYGLPGGNSGVSLEMVDGGIMENISINNLSIEGPQVPLFVRLGNRGRKFNADAATPGMGIAKNIQISNIMATGADATGCSFTGIPGAPLENVSLSNIHIETSGNGYGIQRPFDEKTCDAKADSYPEATMFGQLPSYGLYFRNAKNIHLANVFITHLSEESRPAVLFSQTENYKVDDLSN